MSKSLPTYYEGVSIAATDIGAITFLGDRLASEHGTRLAVYLSALVYQR